MPGHPRSNDPARPIRSRSNDPAPVRLLCHCLALAAVVLLGLLPATQAHAEPTPEEIEAMIDKKWEQLEPIIEQYNKVHSQLRKNQKKSAALKKKIVPLSRKVDLAFAQIGELATRNYISGPSSQLNALLGSDSPATFADRLLIVDRLAKQRQKQIAGVTAARDKYAAAKRQLDALIAEQKKQDAQLAAKKKKINAEIDRLQRMRAAAYGSSSSGGSLRKGPCPAVYIGGKPGTAVKTACAQIGDPYVWGTNGPDTFDCSGLMQYAWDKAGVQLTHHTGAQWNETYGISRSEARPGDIVFFYSDRHHNGMYVGKGLVVHAPQTGDRVRMEEVDDMPIAGWRRVRY